MIHLEAVVVIVDLRAHLHFLELHLVLLLLGLARPAILFVLELPVVHDPAYGRSRGGRHLHQIETPGLGESQRLARGENSDLRPIVRDDTHLGNAYALVDPDFRLFGCRNSIHLRVSRSVRPGRACGACKNAGRSFRSRSPARRCRKSAIPWDAAKREPLA